MENENGIQSGNNSVSVVHPGAGMSINITHLRKIDCQRASNRPGYFCKYELSVDNKLISREGTSAGEKHAEVLTTILKSISPEMTIETRRFVRSGSGWQVFQN